MFCPFCGCKVSDGCKFCPECGNKLQTVDVSSNVAPPKIERSKQHLENRKPTKLNSSFWIVLFIMIGAIAAFTICCPFCMKSGTSTKTATADDSTGRVNKRTARIPEAENKSQRKAVSKISAASLKDHATPEAVAAAVAAANRQRTPEERRQSEKELQERIDRMNKIALIAHVKSIRDAAANHVISVREAKDKIKAYLDTQEGWSSKDLEKGWAGTKTSEQTLYMLGIRDIENMTLDDIVEMVSK